MQGDNCRMLRRPNIMMVPNLVNQQQSRGPLAEAGRVQQQQQTPAAGVQMVHELSSSNQEVVGNSMRFMQAPSPMNVQSEGVIDPNINHGLLEFIPTPGDPNVRTGASPV